MSSHPYVTQQNTPLADDTTLMSTTCLLYTSIAQRPDDDRRMVFLRVNMANNALDVDVFPLRIVGNTADIADICLLYTSALQLSPHHRLIQKQRVRHGNYQFINLVRIRVDLIYYLIQNFTAVLVLQQGPGHYRARADAGVAWCYHEMHSFPLFFFLE